MDEPRVDRDAKLDILLFGKKMNFSIPISTVALKSTFSVGGRVIDQFKSALKPGVVEALVCTRDWLYADICNVFFIYMLAE